MKASSQSDGAGVYLKSYLEPLRSVLERPDVTDIYINAPGEIWVETTSGTVETKPAPTLDDTTLWRLARQIAAMSHQGISREHPLLSATLPDGARVQIVAPPATRGSLAIAIRKHLATDLTLADYVAAGALKDVSVQAGFEPGGVDTALDDRLRLGDIAGVLGEAVRSRKNILISGGTSTGKTTFLNALLREVPPEERLIFIEDTPELQIRQANAVGLVAARSRLGESEVTTNDLVAASLRMRPDRIILGELRGDEAYAFLRAVNTGHPGSMTTVHADSAERAVEQIALLVLQGGTRLSREDVHFYVRRTVDLFVQLSRAGGRRHVAQVVLNDTLA
ncbi:P-type DNA transfer ATPase VirB11 [Allosphingosinicella deserti]|uniref:Type IV secretion system protein n=1 Tax=Allosphingosinicella deserti TaxID=2116704 RepID=A0A2P7QEK8_9SPHN|nr:P-type DNA transfer ATPase VirB11 [Sphingomonas deserti]PSJ36401.1 P-type DNA transfer ATPase VirB11 [Sphingomonas deserti]